MSPALRSIIQVHTNDGRCGLGESYGDEQTLAHGRHRAQARRRRPVRPERPGASAARLWTARPTPAAATSRAAPGRPVPSALEVAFLDLQGQALGKPLCDILGERVVLGLPVLQVRAVQPGGIGRPDDPRSRPTSTGVPHARAGGRPVPAIHRRSAPRASSSRAASSTPTTRSRRSARCARRSRSTRASIPTAAGRSTRPGVSCRSCMPPRPRAASRVGGADTSLRQGRAAGALRGPDEPTRRDGEVATFATMPLATNSAHHPPATPLLGLTAARPQCAPPSSAHPGDDRAECRAGHPQRLPLPGRPRATQHLAHLGRLDIGISMHPTRTVRANAACYVSYSQLHAESGFARRVPPVRR